jgi:hypothetical protein
VKFNKVRHNSREEAVISIIKEVVQVVLVDTRGSIKAVEEVIIITADSTEEDTIRLRFLNTLQVSH